MFDHDTKKEHRHESSEQDSQGNARKVSKAELLKQAEAALENDAAKVRTLENAMAGPVYSSPYANIKQDGQRGPGSWTRQQRRVAQGELVRLKLYDGEIDGLWGPKFENALEAAFGNKKNAEGVPIWLSCDGNGIYYRLARAQRAGEAE